MLARIEACTSGTGSEGGGRSTKGRVLAAGVGGCDNEWYDDKRTFVWIDALAELRQRATREGHCYARPGDPVAIDQYAEKR